MKYILLILTIVTLSYCQTNSDKSNCFNYPSQINDLKIGDLYDTARWVLYNWLSDRKEGECYYGQMKLIFKSALLRNDSLEIFFNFYHPDTIPSTGQNSNAFAWGSVAFKMDTKKRLWAFFYPFENFSDGLESGDKQLDYPPSDKALRFIKSHRDSLNVCYLALAEKLKIIN